jgi:hypothetical protein
MPSTDVIQSFRLRFWREPSRGASNDWRGDVWHEQQKPGDEAIAVANPDQAFELVRSRLQGLSQDPGAGPASADPAGLDHRDNRGGEDSPPSSPGLLRLVLGSILRKLQGWLL